MSAHSVLLRTCPERQLEVSSAQKRFTSLQLFVDPDFFAYSPGSSYESRPTVGRLSVDSRWPTVGRRSTIEVFLSSRSNFWLHVSDPKSLLEDSGDNCFIPLIVEQAIIIAYVVSGEVSALECRQPSRTAQVHLVVAWPARMWHGDNFPPRINFWSSQWCFTYGFQRSVVWLIVGHHSAHASNYASVRNQNKIASTHFSIWA